MQKKGILALVGNGNNKGSASVSQFDQAQLQTETLKIVLRITPTKKIRFIHIYIEKLNTRALDSLSHVKSKYRK